MKHTGIKALVFTLILIFYGSLLVHKIELPVRDDLARHIKNGEMILQGHYEVIHKNVYSYVEPNHSFYNHNWLSGILYYLLQSTIGWDGLVFLKVFLFLLTFTIVFITATKKANFWVVALFSLPTIMMLRERTTMRPELFSLFFIALYLYLLTDLEQHPERKRIFWLIPLQLLWVNMHLFFIAGIGLCAGFLVEKIIIYRKNLAHNYLVKKLSILLILLVVVSFANPNGITGTFFPFRIFENYGMAVSENQSPFYFLRLYPPLDNISIFVLFPSVVLLGLSFLFVFRKKPIFYLLIGASTAIAALRMDRLLPLFCLMFLPIVSTNLENRLMFLEQFGRKNVFTFLFVGLLCCLIFLGSRGTFSNYNKIGIGLTPQSNTAAEFFKEHGLRGPIFNDFDIGSYLVYHLYPQEQVFVDNRSEAYTAAFFTQTYLPLFQDEKIWQQTSNKYAFNVIFMYLYDDSPGVRLFMYQRMHDPDWSLVYADSYAIILLRNKSENQGTITEFKITEENAEKRLEYLVQSARYDEQVAAGDIFFLLGRADLGVKTFLQIVEHFPNKGKLWMVLGEWELRNNPKLAIQYLTKAVATGHSTAEAYYSLGVAYEKTGETKNARESLQTSLKINPNQNRAKQLLEDIGSL